MVFKKRREPQQEKMVPHHWVEPKVLKSPNEQEESKRRENPAKGIGKIGNIHHKR